MNSVDIGRMLSPTKSVLDGGALLGDDPDPAERADPAAVVGVRCWCWCWCGWCVRSLDEPAESGAVYGAFAVRPSDGGFVTIDRSGTFLRALSCCCCCWCWCSRMLVLPPEADEDEPVDDSGGESAGEPEPEPFEPVDSPRRLGESEGTGTRCVDPCRGREYCSGGGGGGFEFEFWFAANASVGYSGTGGGGELGETRSLPLKRRMNPLFFLFTCRVGPLMGESPGARGASSGPLPFPPALVDRARPWTRWGSRSVSTTSGLDGPP